VRVEQVAQCKLAVRVAQRTQAVRVPQNRRAVLLELAAARKS